MSASFAKSPTSGSPVAATLRQIDEVVRPLPAEMGAEPHHHRLGHDHAQREIEIGAHAGGVDLETRYQEPGLRQRTR
jgi:hypothetical protein